MSIAYYSDRINWDKSFASSNLLLVVIIPHCQCITRWMTHHLGYEQLAFQAILSSGQKASCLDRNAAVSDSWISTAPQEPLAEIWWAQSASSQCQLQITFHYIFSVQLREGCSSTALLSGTGAFQSTNCLLRQRSKWRIGHSCAFHLWMKCGTFPASELC